MTVYNLVDAINAFHAARNRHSKRQDFTSIKDEDAWVEEAYGVPMRVLCNWQQPLTSLEEVREAIRIAFTEDAIIDDIAKAALRQALVYLDKLTDWHEPAGKAA